MRYCSKSTRLMAVGLVYLNYTYWLSITLPATQTALLTATLTTTPATLTAKSSTYSHEKEIPPNPLPTQYPIPCSLTRLFLLRWRLLNILDRRLSLLMRGQSFQESFDRIRTFLPRFVLRRHFPRNRNSAFGRRSADDRSRHIEDGSFQ